MSWPPAMRLVLVEWIDSSGSGGWRGHDDMREHVRAMGLGCKTVGWVLLEAPDRLALVGSLAETGSVDDATTIPRVAILSITDLEEP